MAGGILGVVDTHDDDSDCKCGIDKEPCANCRSSGDGGGPKMWEDGNYGNCR